MGDLERKKKAGPISNVVCPGCGRTLDDVIESLVRQRGRFKGQREDARRQLRGAVQALEQITDTPYDEPRQMHEIAQAALDRLGGR